MLNDSTKIRRQDRALDEKRALELLETAEYGFLCMGESLDGYAYGIPLNYAYDRAGNTVYFHGAPEGHKLDNLKRNSKVSFCVVGKTQPVPEKFTTKYESVIVFGVADIHPTDDEKKDALRKLVAKYCPGHIESGESYIGQAASYIKRPSSGRTSAGAELWPPR